ncbi:Fur family transcriptional regulator [Oceaniglobus trochenteri]|uniref:Fur family transcriptional regulator n=1 Tax=Oceaniglobus trochenteri TaxID=2763260 RepID=UPI001CFFCE09|nr:Fur family transcriptional regulator [Oceaniglobus trochenteri]
MTLAADKTAKMTTALRKAGVRVTRQRIALLSVLVEADDHPHAEELHSRAKQIEPAVSLATVYRTLSVLEAEGVVHRHSFEGGGARFETATEAHHDHIVDLDSGEVIEFNSDKIERLQDEIAAELGYDVVHHRMELYCRKRKDRA